MRLRDTVAFMAHLTLGLSFIGGTFSMVAVELANDRPVLMPPMEIVPTPSAPIHWTDADADAYPGCEKVPNEPSYIPHDLIVTDLDGKRQRLVYDRATVDRITDEDKPSLVVIGFCTDARS